MSTAIDITGTSAAAAACAVWVPCPTCWGQRRILRDHNGEGLVPHACPECLGLGERLVATGGMVA